MISEKIKGIRMSALKKMLAEYDERFDEEVGLIYQIKEESIVLRSKVMGKVHGIILNREYVQLIFMAEAQNKYHRAVGILKKICEMQDKNPENITYGLWPYFVEEGFGELTVPDYNYAEFVGSTLIYAIKEKKDLLDKELITDIKEALRRAAYCCIRRNVGVDYTNVACMSIFTIIAIAEIIEDEFLFKKGKEKLEHFIEYTRHNDAFNEYNSPNYIQIAGDAIAKMLMYFEDAECRKMAEELNYVLWEMCALHYSTKFNQLTPPYSRSYMDIDEEGQVSFFVYLATNGKYGLNTGCINFYQLSDLSCPEELYPLFEENGWVKKAYYKKNDIRNADEDVTIVRDFESPDLIAYSYMTDDYLFGSFQKSDAWSQRRTLAAIWDKDNIKSSKLVCLKNGAEFCCGMSYIFQDENKAVALLGFCNDHGDSHYIIDLLDGGRVSAQSLMFKLLIGGNSKGICFEEQDGIYVLSDGDIRINIKVEKWIFDGEEATIRVVDDGIELVCFDGNERMIDLEKLKESYAVISFAINEKPVNIKTEINGERIQIKAEDGSSLIDGYTIPKTYNDCVRNTVVN